MRRVLTSLLVIALFAAVTNQALALKLSNANTGEVYFLEDGCENDTVGQAPDNPEVGTWDTGSQVNLPASGGAGVVDSSMYPADIGPPFSGSGHARGAPGPKYGKNYYTQGINTNTGQSTTRGNIVGTIEEGDRIHMEWFLFLRDENDGGGNVTNSFPWHINLRNSAGEIVAGLANGWTPVRPVTSTTNLSLTGAGGVGEYGDVFGANEWVKFDLLMTVGKSFSDPEATPDMQVFLSSDRVGKVGPLVFGTPANSTGDITQIHFGNDDRPNNWFLDWPEPGTLSLLSIGGLLLMKRRTRKA